MNSPRSRRSGRPLASALAGAGLLLLSATAAHAAPPRYPDIFPLSRVRPGMVGYGLTTFHGTTPTRFQVKVIGILRKENNGRDMILIRMNGGPITERGANLIRGMSGSPIFLDGKVAGAFSMGESYQKEPVGMVTPIEDMLDAWDPNVPQAPSYFQLPEINGLRSVDKGRKVGANWKPNNGERIVSLPQPMTVNGRQISRLVLNARENDPRRSTQGTAVLRRATTLLAVTGIGEADRETLEKDLQKRGYNVSVVRGGGGGGGGRGAETFHNVTMQPGSPIGTYIATGDIELGGMGTVTYRRGNKLLAFGHPMFGMGALEMPVTYASVVDVIALVPSSHFNWTSGPIVGTMVQDRDYSIACELGRTPATIPFEVTVNDTTHRRTKTFRSRIFLHPEWTPLAMRTIAQQAVSQLRNIPGDVYANVTTTIDAAQMGSITKKAVVYSGDGIAGAVTSDLTDITGVLSGNPFYPVPIKSGRMTIQILPGRNTVTIERAYVKQGKFEPGENAEIGVVLRPYRGTPFTKTLALRIPPGTPSGRYQVQVRGGGATVQRIGPFVISGSSADSFPPPVTVRQMFDHLKEQSQNTDLIAKLQLNSFSPMLEGEKLTQLPPYINALMRSERNSSVRLERDEIKTSVPNDFIVSGSAQFFLQVNKKSIQEPGGGSSGGGGSLGGGPSMLSRLPGSGTRASVSDDEYAESPLNESSIEPFTMVEPSLRPWILARTGFAVLPDDKKQTPKKPVLPVKEPEKKPEPAVPAVPVNPPANTTPAPPTPPAPEPTPDKPVGRQLQVWRQSAKTDFAAGKFAGTAITGTGELTLTPSLRLLASTPETYIWTLTPDGKGNLLAGTGTSGTIYRIRQQAIPSGGTHIALANLPVLAVHSLLAAKDGSIYAACGMKASLYRLDGKGSATLLGTTPDKLLTALAEDSKGTIYASSGSSGQLYRVAAGTNALKPFVKLGADYISTLLTDAQDNLYVGTGNDGLVYKVTPDGKTAVVFDGKEDAVTALAMDGKGSLYIGTGPKGNLYQIAVDGTTTLLFDKATSFFTAMKAAPDGSLYAATVNAVYQVLPGRNGTPAVVRPLDNPKDVDILTLAVGDDNRIFVGTGNSAEVYAANVGAKSGTFESLVRDARTESRWGSLRWNAALPKGARLRVETRTGTSAEPDGTWSGWSEVRAASGVPFEGRITSPMARFLQYRLTLESGDTADAMPLVKEVSLAYMPRNQAPKVTFQSPAGGERWMKAQTIRWNASDPDSDTLTYDVFYSADNGTTWKPFPASDKPKSDTPATTTPAAPSGSGDAPKPLSMDEYQKRLDSTSLPPATKQMLLERHRMQLEAAGSGGSTSGATKETSKSLDTTLLPDGVYVVKVVASDALGNATDALTAATVSEPFLVCNTPPKVTVSGKPTIGAESTVTLEGTVRQNLIAVTAVQYRIDTGDWMAAIPKDGLFDSLHEEFAILTAPLKSGKHTLEILAFNAAGNKTTEKVTVEIP